MPASLPVTLPRELIDLETEVKGVEKLIHGLKGQVEKVSNTTTGSKNWGAVAEGEPRKATNPDTAKAINILAQTEKFLSDVAIKIENRDFTVEQTQQVEQGIDTPKGP